ncbi:MAG: 50S ribosomal protein L22 [bacterium]
MEAVARARYIRTSPQKARLVVDLVRGKTAEEALNILSFTPKSTARVVKKLLESAIANATHKGNIDVDTLYVKRIFVDSGPAWKRFQPRAMGRATRVKKRTSHITVVLDEA